MCSKYVLYIFLFMHMVAYSVDVGSDTAVTLFNNQVSLVNADRIAGFAALNGGFFFSNTATTVLFDSFFSVAGNIQLNGGTLNLNQDLIFQDVTNIISLGNINANLHQVEIAPGTVTIPSGQTESSCAITFITDETQLDLANEVDWSPDSRFVVVGIDDAGGASQQVLVYEFDGSTLTFRGGVDVGGDVETVNWHPTNDWIAVGRVTGGNEVSIYSFNRITGVMTLIGSTAVYVDTVNSVVWHPAGGHLAVGSNDNAIRVRVYVVSGAGALGANVTVNPGADVNTVDWSRDGTFLAVGTDAFAGNELQVYTFNSGALTLTLNAGSNVANQVNCVSWNPVIGNTDLIALGVNAGTGRVRVYRHNSGAGTLTLLTGAQAINATIVNFVNWNLFSGCLAACLNVNAEGTGGEIRIYVFLNDAITETDSEELGDSVFGGRWSYNGDYFGSADNGGGPGGPELSIYRFDPTLSNANNIFSNIRLFLNNNLTMQDCRITFTGNNLIGGRNNTLTLMPTATLAVGSNSSLLFQNVRIEGIKNGSIIALDNSATFSFQNCTFVMDSNYTFSLGRFDVLRGFNLQGKNTNFIYTSNQKSRILAEGNMLIDTDVTFSYAPINNSNALLEMTNINSTLSLISGTIATSLAGLRLTKGRLWIDGESFLRNGGTTQSQGIFWGDGVNSVNNLQLEWQPAATLQLISGFLVNANV